MVPHQGPSPFAAGPTGASECPIGRSHRPGSTIVLAEVLYIAENKRVPVEFPELLGRIRAGRGYQIVDFDLAVLQEMQKLSQDLELHDRALAATALVYDAALITKDRELQKLDRPKVVW